MMSIVPVPRPSIARTRSVRRDPRCAARVIAGALLSSLFLAGYASNAAAEEKRARSASAPAEAEGGNPKYYNVFGKRYRVRASSDGYREEGVASWYGRPFHGRPTSSGEMYDMNEMTAAHTTLPLPTWVEVTNLANGKRVVVKVNDRGPFVGKRVIDLSYAAATALDMVKSGTQRVEVRALDGPPREKIADRHGKRSQTSALASASANERTKPAKPAKPIVAPAAPPKPQPDPSARKVEPQPPPAQSAERLFAQAGKFKERDDAVQLVDSLKAQGFVNAFVVTEDGRRRSLHRVRVGPLIDATERKRMSDLLRGLGAKRSQSVVMR